MPDHVFEDNSNTMHDDRNIYKDRGADIMKYIKCIDLGIPGIERLFLECPYGTTILIKGERGLGKTFMGIHFIERSLVAGEEVIYINFFENKEEFLWKASSIGIDLKDYMDSKLHYFQKSVYSEKSQLLYFVSVIQETIRARKIKKVVIDTIDALTAVLTGEEYRVFILELMQRIKELGATLLIIKDVGIEDRRYGYEEVIADIIIELMRKRGPHYETRYLMVTKSRYASYIPIPVEYTITSGGVQVYPPYRYTQSYQGVISSERIPTGIPKLDEILDGGIPANSIVCIKGPTGTYKTLLALSIAAYNASKGKKVMLSSYKESREQLLHYLKILGYDYNSLKNNLSITSINPIYISPARLYAILIRLLEEGGYDIRIADGAEASLKFMDEDERTFFTHSILQAIKAMGVTEIIVYNQDKEYYIDEYSLDYIADVVIATRINEKLGSIRKEIAILKNRGNPIKDHGFHEIEFYEGKLVVK
ncbi:MAG: hypothetical protein DRO40_02190 [Thermoprotei archaeon]|nr:MAG: hypothetical protein DRO40_02190 [Thermoprotei archaeon]